MNIYLVLDINLYNIIIEYCNSLKKKFLNSKILIWSNDKFDINVDDIYIFFGLHYINYPIICQKNVFYINLEQLTINGKNTQYNILDRVLNLSKINICDYSQGNINILKEYNIQSIYLPYQVNTDEIFDYDKIYNFSICCSWNSRIEYIYNNICEKYKNTFSIGHPPLYGNDRDNILFKTKVLGNIHHREYDYNILEEIRITRCILNKVIVISEYSLDYEKYPLSKYIIFTEYNNMINTINNVLDNYDYYYDKIYNNFDINKIDDELYDYINNFIKYVNQ